MSFDVMPQDQRENDRSRLYIFISNVGRDINVELQTSWCWILFPTVRHNGFYYHSEKLMITLVLNLLPTKMQQTSDYLWKKLLYFRQCYIFYHFRVLNVFYYQFKYQVLILYYSNQLDYVWYLKLMSRAYKLNLWK